MQMPVTSRSSGAASERGSTTSSSALAIAPTIAEAANRCRNSSRSANPNTALTRQPTTKPTCTAVVSVACSKFDKWNSAASDGITAEAENQSAIAATWQAAMIVIDAPFDDLNSITEGAQVGLGLRQRHALLPLILAATVLVRDGADLVGLEEDHLRDAFVRVD